MQGQFHLHKNVQWEKCNKQNVNELSVQGRRRSFSARIRIEVHTLNSSIWLIYSRLIYTFCCEKKITGRAVCNNADTQGIRLCRIKIRHTQTFFVVVVVVSFEASAKERVFALSRTYVLSKKKKQH